MKWTMLLLLCLITVGTSVTLAHEPLHYTCYKTSGQITIDGKLDESAWGTAPWTELFVDVKGDVKLRPRFCTRAMMLWDDTYFYVAAYMEEPDIWATLTAWDAVIYRDNDFEVFIDPNGDELEYYEFEMNALNTGWDLFLDKPYDDGGTADNSWSIPGLKTDVHIYGTLNDPSDIDQGWSVELAFPWEVLAEYAHKPSPPNHGDEWRVNLLRVDYYMDIVDGRYQIRSNSPRSDWVWTVHRTWIHDPEDWGYVHFSTDSENRPPKVLTVTTTPDTIFAGQSMPVDITLALADLLNAFPRMCLDLSPIGLSSTFPLEHEGAGQYTTNITIPPLPNDRYHVPVMADTSDGNDWYPIYTMTLEVYPGEDMIIYDEALSHGWKVESPSATIDFQATDYVHSGNVSHAISSQQGGWIKYIFEEPDSFSTFGYTHLEFYFHPGIASVRILRTEVVGTGTADLKKLGIDFKRKEWQKVQIKLSGDGITSNIMLAVGLSGEGTFYIDDMKLSTKRMDISTAVEQASETAAIPSGYALSQNYPNPFNPQTRICYELPQPGRVVLKIFSLLGQEIRTLVNQEKPAGQFHVLWNGKDDSGNRVASGIYLYRIESQDFVQTKKLVLLQ